jgi:hypothetical protein
VRVTLLLVATQTVVGLGWQVVTAPLLPPRRSIVEHPVW